MSPLRKKRPTPKIRVGLVRLKLLGWTPDAAQKGLFEDFVDFGKNQICRGQRCHSHDVPAHKELVKLGLLRFRTKRPNCPRETHADGNPCYQMILTPLGRAYLAQRWSEKP